MKMNCEKISKLITDKLAGELSVRKQRLLEKHLENCESCRKELEEMRQIWGLAEKTLKEEELPEALESAHNDRIFEAAEAAGKRKKILFMDNRRWFELAASVAILVILAGIFLPIFSTVGTKPKMFSAKLAEDKLLDFARSKTRREIQLCDQKASPASSPLMPGKSDTMPGMECEEEAILITDTSVQNNKPMKNKWSPMIARRQEVPILVPDTSERKGRGAAHTKYGNVLFKDGHVAGGGEAGWVAADHSAVSAEISRRRNVFDRDSFVDEHVVIDTVSVDDKNDVEKPRESYSFRRVMASPESVKKESAVCGELAIVESSTEYRSKSGLSGTVMPLTAPRTERLSFAQKTGKKLKESVGMLGDVVSLSAFNSCREKARRTSCTSNLKQIGLALEMYSNDFDGRFPHRDGADGLEMLRSGDYITDYKIFLCPSRSLNREFRNSGPLDEEIVDYVFIGGLGKATHYDMPVAFDKAGNHRDYFNVLYVDGRVNSCGPEKFNREIAKVEKYLANRKLALPSESFHLNLKLWDLTSEQDVRSFFERHGIGFDDVKKIVVDKRKNLLKITAALSVLKKIGAAVDKLRKAEEMLNERKNGLPFIRTRNKPVSTFSIDVDTASYTAARKKIRNGQRPEPSSVRPEEFINYFDYHYRSPRNSVFGVYLKAARLPLRSDTYLFRIAVQGKKLGPDRKNLSSFTVLVDTSGSMASKDRLSLVRKSLKMLMEQLRPNDRISIVACGDNAKILANRVPIARRDFLKGVISGISASGATDLDKGINSAYDAALRNYVPGGCNKVVIFSDGIFEADSLDLAMILKKIETARAKGIGNTVIAVGGDGDDKLMETLADKGDGSYVFLDSEEEAEDLFRNQFAARFRGIAKDVKIQVEFNPAVVESYRQVGYDNRRLSKADFRNDKVDAGEVGSGQSVTALYELRLKPGSAGKTVPVATVRLRYKKLPSLELEEKEYYFETSEIKDSFDNMPDNFKLAFIAGEFAENLKYPDVPGIANPSFLKGLLEQPLRGTYRNDRKVRELYELLNSMK